MSVHLVECASEVEIGSALKLALLCFADSGSNDGRVALPGVDGVMKWCCVGRSQAFRLIARLQELQLLELRRSGYRGRRSEYIVFPNGCCEKHGKVPAALKQVRADDVAEVVAISQQSHIRDSIPGCGLSDPVRLLDAEQSHPEPGKGRISAPERVASPRSILEPSKSTTPTTSTSGTTHHQPLTPRETGPPSPNPILEMARNCPHCIDGDICDSQGLPIAPCQHCQPQPIRGVSA